MCYRNTYGVCAGLSRLSITSDSEVALCVTLSLADSDLLVNPALWPATVLVADAVFVDVIHDVFYV